jgi:HPt (histidine-containing phosphotransfer) domain-containing protein
MIAEVLSAFRRTCEEDVAGLKQALAANDAQRVAETAHRMAGASKMVGALAFAAACENVDRVSRTGDWKAILAGMPAFEREHARLAEYFDSRKSARW